MLLFLQSTDTNKFDGKTGQVYGWGTTWFWPPIISDTLLEANVTVATNKLCQQEGRFNKEITDGMLCAGGSDMDACQVRFQ